MGFLGGKKKSAGVTKIINQGPAQQPNAPIPTGPNQDPAAAQAAQDAIEMQIKIARNAQGRQSTILTSGQGDVSPATVGKKTLLGQ